jgi:hypothetical protein
MHYVGQAQRLTCVGKDDERLDFDYKLQIKNCGWMFRVRALQRSLCARSPTLKSRGTARLYLSKVLQNFNIGRRSSVQLFGHQKLFGFITYCSLVQNALDFFELKECSVSALLPSRRQLAVDRHQRFHLGDLPRLRQGLRLAAVIPA